MSKKYLLKAKKLNASGFWMAGYGNFDITLEELAIVLQLVEENKFKELREFYEKLQRQRL